MGVTIGASGRSIQQTSSLPAATAYTMCGWVSLASIRAGQFQYFSSLESATTLASFGIYMGFKDTGTFQIFAADAGGSTELNFGTAPTAGSYFFFAVTCAGTGATDLNGYWAPIGATAFTSTVTGVGRSFTTAALIGGNDSFDEWCDITLADFSVFNAALTSAELLQQLKQQMNLRTSNLQSFSRLVDSSNVSPWTAVGTLGTAAGPDVPWIAGDAAIFTQKYIVDPPLALPDRGQERFAEPVLVPAPPALPDLSWAPKLAFPRTLPPPANVVQAVEPLSPALPVPSLSWQATIALPQPAPPPANGVAVEPLLPIAAATVPPLSWAPVTAQLSPPPALPATSGGVEPLSPAFPVPPLAWAPSASPAVRLAPGASSASAIGPVAPVTASTVPPLSWLPVLAEVHLLPQPAPPVMTGRMFEASPGSADLSWSPVTAVNVRREPAPPIGMAIEPLLPIAPTVTPLSWAPVTAQPRLAPTPGSGVAVAPLLPIAATVPPLSWLPVQAQMQGSAALPASSGGVEPFAPALPVPPLSWFPAGAPAAAPAAAIATRGSIAPVQANILPDLSWMPSEGVSSRPLPPLATAGAVEPVVTVSVIPTPASWQPAQASVTPPARAGRSIQPIQPVAPQVVPAGIAAILTRTAALPHVILRVPSAPISLTIAPVFVPPTPPPPITGTNFFFAA